MTENLGRGQHVGGLDATILTIFSDTLCLKMLIGSSQAMCHSLLPHRN